MSKQITMAEEETEVINHKRSLVIVVIFFACFLLLISALVYWLVWGETNLNILDSFKKKTTTSLQLQPGVGETTITVSEKDINASLQNQNFLQHPKAKILSDKIKVTGKSSENFFALNLEIEVVPKVRENQVFFDIVSFKSAGILAPKKIIDQITPELSGYLQSFFILPTGFTPTGVQLTTGYLTIFGELRK